MARKSLLLAFLLLLSSYVRLLAAAPPDPAELSRNPRTVYLTVGDYQDVLFTPLDSEASINAAFDVMQKMYGVKRVWWRGGQDEIWGNQFEIREHNRCYMRLWDWWKDLQYRKVNTNRIAVKAGHDRGVEVWVAYGLFDNGSQPDAGFGGFPYAAEDRIRIEHPEWAPVNKYGTWRQGGPIEFAYPGARKAMVDYLSKYVVDGGYDGIAFLSYVENYSQRYEDEFGYSQPIVDEFKKRHGVDIRTQPFDRTAWAKLRGEYLTHFMRELHAALAKHERKIAVSVDGKNPHLPCIWNVAGGVRTVGRLWLDVETWVPDHAIPTVTRLPCAADKTALGASRHCRWRLCHVRRRATAGIEGTAREWHQRCCDSQPHGGREPEGNLPSLLGHRSRIGVGQGRQGRVGRAGNRSANGEVNDAGG